MNSGLFGGWVALVAMPFVLLIFKRTMPLPKGYRDAGPSLEELKEHLGKRGSAAEGKGAAIGAAVGVALCGVIGLVAFGHYQRFANEPLAVAGQKLFWAIPMLFTVMAGGLAGTFYGLRRFLGEDYESYVRLSRLKANYCVDTINRYLVGLICGIVFLLCGHFFDNYTVFGKDTITLNPFFSLGTTTHSYSEVESIKVTESLQAPNGNIVPRHVCEIRFTSGDVWNSDFGPSFEEDDTRLSEIEQVVSQKSHKQIEAVERMTR
ncbi:hypothetical protein [Armatimonas sp.]|uniref:hypothetical protein n=1 Tax=Armatimonas sp. TaxID=1872638 RepID=UPI00374DCC09